MDHDPAPSVPPAAFSSRWFTPSEARRLGRELAQIKSIRLSSLAAEPPIMTERFPNQGQLPLRSHTE